MLLSGQSICFLFLFPPVNHHPYLFFSLFILFFVVFIFFNQMPSSNDRFNIIHRSLIVQCSQIIKKIIMMLVISIFMFLFFFFLTTIQILFIIWNAREMKHVAYLTYWTVFRKEWEREGTRTSIEHETGILQN